MFQASLLFCWLSLNGPQCLIAEDTYGPHSSSEKCHTRIVEMKKSIKEEMPYAEFRAENCRQLMAGKAA